MHSRFLVTEGLKIFEIEIVNDLTIKLVIAFILCESVRSSTGTRHGFFGYKRYTYHLRYLYRVGRGLRDADTGMLAHVWQDQWVHCQHVVLCFTPFRQQLVWRILTIRGYTS